MLNARLAALDAAAVISVITEVELEGGLALGEGGAARRVRLDAFLSELDILPFSSAEAKAYRGILQRTAYSRRKVTDRMIAATALAAGRSVATLNARDFADIPDLSVDDWSVPA